MQDNKIESADLLTAADEDHVREITDNEDERAKMSALIQSSKMSALSVPNEINWLKIQGRIQPIIADPHPVKEPTVVPFYIKSFAVAASTIFLAMGWLVFSNYQLHNQLEQVLLTNQQLESKLINPKITTYEQVFFVQKLNDIDKKLQNISSLDQKVTLLQKRSVLILELYKTQQGVSDVFSI
jgi:hypothetical protein